MNKGRNENMVSGFDKEELKEYRAKVSELTFREPTEDEEEIADKVIKMQKYAVIPIALFMLFLAFFVYRMITSLNSEDKSIRYFVIAFAAIAVIFVVIYILKMAGGSNYTVARAKVVKMYRVQSNNSSRKVVDIWSDTDRKYVRRIRYFGVNVSEDDEVLIVRKGGKIPAYMALHTTVSPLLSSYGMKKTEDE